MNIKLIFFPLSIAATMFIFFYLTKPTWNEYSEGKQEFSEKQADLAKLERNKSTLDNALQDYAEISVDKKLLIENSIPNKAMEDHFLKELNDVSSETGVMISSIDFLKKDSFEDKASLDENKNIEVVSSEISFEGDYANLKKALYLIENMNRFVLVNESLIKRNKEKDTLSMDLTLSFFSKQSGTGQLVDFKNEYFNNLIGSGLDVAFVDSYMNYREKAIDFNLIETGDKGRSDLFSSSDQIAIADDVENDLISEEEIETGEEQAVDSESSVVEVLVPVE